ncbi:universal stress protein [Bauldia sp.]|uniref:universal stress protein n=1 Tax=Bauldia sp. TaxID=2575872 RepID=UPI003BA99D91
MATKRKSRAEGHRRKFLAVVDDTPECTRALLFAGQRALHTSGALVLLYVIAPSEFTQWAGVENIMRAEAVETAEAALGKAADLVRENTGLEPQVVIREGGRAEEVIKLIEEDEDIAILVLAAGTDSEGPGPLVSALIGKGVATFPVPITVVPGHLDDETVAAVA